MSSHPLRFGPGSWPAAIAVLLVASLAAPPLAQAHGWKKSKKQEQYFQRVSTFPVYLNICEPDDEECISEESYAEILTPTEDGKTIIYIGKHEDDGIVGFVDIKNPSNPKPAGVIEVVGEPTSVAVAGDYALVVVNTRTDFVNTSGQLLVIDIKTRTTVRTMELGGQPDSVVVSPDGRYAAIAIENERDEDFGDGAPPQLPGGYLMIVDIGAKWYHWKNKWQRPVSEWELRKVDLTGLADPDFYPEDPEPEYVDINEANFAVVTLQENNHIAIVYLPTGKVVQDFSAGSVDLTKIDATEDDVINQTESLDDVLREPDAVNWTSLLTFATANEGDLDGGSRGFSIFAANGKVLYDSGNELEQIIARVGHYPESRSENKGNEPEAVKYETFGSDKFLFVGSERSSTVAVYKLDWLGRPDFHQILPGGWGPEGLATHPGRGLMMTSSENDDRASTFRSVITIYQLQKKDPAYPTVVSDDRPDGTPIPWAGLSALAADPMSRKKAYTVYDAFFAQSRIYTLDMSETPPVITKETVLMENGSTVNLDLEGIAVRSDGTFWVATEGAGNCNGATCPASATPNQIIKVDKDGTVLARINLPAGLALAQRSNGFEGVTVTGTVDIDEVVYVAFQRAWTAAGDVDGLQTRIGRYDVAADEWTFAYYTLDMSETNNPGDWVGLSEITAINDTTFVVIERDKQAGLDAKIKKLYQFTTNGVTFKAWNDPALEVVPKLLVRDVLPDMAAPNGAVIEKLEGFMVLRDGTSWIVTDNDGTDDVAGETQLINLGRNVP